jgi:hypothetical protein
MHECVYRTCISTALQHLMHTRTAGWHVHITVQYMKVHDTT